MKKEIQNEINKLFSEMENELNKKGKVKKLSHKGRAGKHREYSAIAVKYSEKSIYMMKDTSFLGSQAERIEFMRGFGRKIKSYIWIK